MRKIAALLTALLLLFSACALALSGADYPAWDGASAPADSLYGDIAGSRLMLEFDAASDYSNLADGFIQACFFAFDRKQQNYLELYMMLPENAAAGDVYSSASASMSSISLYEVSMDSEVLYFAGQAAGFSYPDGSSYELHITSAQRSQNAISISGILNGTLCKFVQDNPTRETLSLSGVNFSFTLPVSATAPESTPMPEASRSPFQTQPPQAAPSAAPKATMVPHPAFTLPPDYAVI